MFEIHGPAATFQGQRTALEASGLQLASGEASWVPKNTVDVNDPGIARQVIRLVDGLEEHEDIQNVFANYEIIEVDPSEPAAANVLSIGDVTVCAAAYPRTNARLAAAATVRTVDVSELAKAEGALTCCSLIFNRGARLP